MKLKLGFSTCPNDTFIFDAIVNKKIDTQGLDFDIIMADVEELNQMAVKGGLDITKMSFHVYPFVSEKFEILNSGSALGNSNGPLLISKSISDLENNNNYKTGVPGKYTTANLLLSLAFPQITQKENMLFSDIEDALLNEKIDLGLIIHENRFTYEAKGLKKIVDLGEYWHKTTNLPLPLGGIIIKRELDQATKTKFDRLLYNSIKFAFENPDESFPFVKKHAQEMEKDVMYKHINLYVNEYTRQLGEEGKKAITTMFELASKAGLIPEVKQPYFLSNF